MDTILRFADRTITVTLPATEGDAATVDGAPHGLERLARGPATGAPGGWTVEDVALEIDGRPVHATVARRPDRVLVAVHGRLFAFAVGDEARAGAAHAGSGVVLAPMPGKVTRVLVAPGDEVEVGQALIVVEAMKMETTLAAEVAGRVGAVHALAGSMVDGGAVLVEIAAR